MSTKLKIKVTKEILQKSKMCGFDEQSKKCTIGYSGNCAVALAVKDIFSDALVGYQGIQPFSGYNDRIRISKDVVDFLGMFDSVVSPDERTLFPEFEFEIEIPDYIINRINIEELRPLLINHPTLELV